MMPASPMAVGEHLMLRLAAPRWGSSLERELRALEPGGVLLAGPWPPSPEALSQLLVSLSQSLPLPLILALQAEGPDALSPLLPPLPSPSVLARKGVRFARRAGELIGEALRLLGFNAYFALTLDLAQSSGEESTSTFGADPRAVADCGGCFLEGLARSKILVCAKHFPGLGGASPAAAAGEELGESGRSMAELWRSDLIPFRELLPRLPLVLMSAAAYRAYDVDFPQSAVLSERVVEGLLRRKLGYCGVVVAPQLESPQVCGVLDPGQAAVQSLEAGCDMLLMEKEESWQAMRRGIEEALASGTLAPEHWEQSGARIRGLRAKCSPPKSPFSKTAWERLARRIEEFNSGD